MDKFKRYTMVIRRDEEGFATPAFKVRQKGEVLKYDEVKGYLPPISNENIDKVKCKAWSPEPLVACKQGFKGLCSDIPCILTICSQG